jgi:hypothetical protein
LVAAINKNGFLTKHPHDETYLRTTYAAISRGKPRGGRFITYKRYPSGHKNAAVKESQELVSNQLLAMFETRFMAPPLVTVSFVGNPTSEDPHLTAQINQALGLSPEGPIKYIHVSLIEHFAFWVTGGHRHCVHEDPCFAFGYQPADVGEYLLPDLIFIPHISFMTKDQHPEKRRILIMQQTERDSVHFGFPTQFIVVGTYPPVRPNEQIDKKLLEIQNDLDYAGKLSKQLRDQLNTMQIQASGSK